MLYVINLTLVKYAKIIGTYIAYHYYAWIRAMYSVGISKGEFIFTEGFPFFAGELF